MEVTTWAEALRRDGPPFGRLSEHAGRNASERRAGLEKHNAEADPPLYRGRQPASGKRAMRAPGVSAGVWAAACVPEGDGGNTGSPVGGVHAPTGLPRGTGRAGQGGGEARSTGEAGSCRWREGASVRERCRQEDRTAGDWREPISSGKVRRLQSASPAQAKEDPDHRAQQWPGELARAVDAPADQRLSQWLCRQHQAKSGHPVRYPSERLRMDFGLVRLPVRTASFPWAKAGSRPRAGCWKLARPVR